jgi:hypothetical protein
VNAAEQEFFTAHESEFQDAVEPPRFRSLPRHRARSRPHWKPSSEPVEAQHAHHGDTFVR